MAIIFDIHGLVNYPGFVETVIQPLEAAGQSIRFYTRDFNPNAALDLHHYKLDRYIPTLISAEHTKHFRSILKRSLRVADWGVALRFPWLVEQAHLYLAGSLEHFGAPHHPEHVRNVMEKGALWLATSKEFGTHLKFPPLFVDKPFLFVESDNVCWGNSGISWGGYNYDAQEALAQRCGYSLLYTPEYPGIWEGFQPRHTARETLAHIYQTITRWKGEIFTRAVGDELGLYPEGGSFHPERR